MAQETKSEAARQPVILCIEDEPEMIDLIRLILERRGYKVLGAIGGEEGMRPWKARCPISSCWT
jgi:CheY-like chemotaxis protein